MVEGGYNDYLTYRYNYEKSNRQAIKKDYFAKQRTKTKIKARKEQILKIKTRRNHKSKEEYMRVYISTN